MPRLICSKCRRTVWATVPAAHLFAEERRCARCGAALADDRRQIDRRVGFRRQAAPEAPPPGDERREGERRTMQRRQGS